MWLGFCLFGLRAKVTTALTQGKTNGMQNQSTLDGARLGARHRGAKPLLPKRVVGALWRQVDLHVHARVAMGDAAILFTQQYRTVEYR